MMGDGLTAIDVLLLLDGVALDRVKALNARMLESVPSGFAFDEWHTPHITLLQRYVHTAQLGAVSDVVGATVATVPVSAIELTAVGLTHQEDPSTPGVGSAVVSVVASPVVHDLHAALIEATAPWTAAGGDASAFVTSDQEPTINAATLEYVERFVPDHSGADFAPHVTVGRATLDDLARLEAAPFESFTFHPASFAIYQLGNNGTAQTRLRHWPSD